MIVVRPEKKQGTIIRERTINQLMTCMYISMEILFFFPLCTAVTHPSVRVTERWEHPVTVLLGAIALIYVAPRSSLLLLWCMSSVHACEQVLQLIMVPDVGVQAGAERKAPVLANFDGGEFWIPSIPTNIFLWLKGGKLICYNSIFCGLTKTRKS